MHAQRRFATLVLSEHFEGKLANNLSNVLSAVKHFKDDRVDVLVHGNACADQVEEVKKYPGINKIFFANNPDLQNSYGDAVAQLTKKLVEINKYDKVVAASSGFGKDVIPRLGGLLDVQPITDVMEIVDGGAKFKRPIYAGNAIATVSSSDSIKLLTVRTTNFDR
jgi:electron transfer flavoprotein alpha subunit